jgi:putative glycerol-1-phosphate prenyltransferase
MFEPKIYHQILQKKKGICVLIDPDKLVSEKQLQAKMERINLLEPDYVLVGGSTVSKHDFSLWFPKIKTLSKAPVLIFPGSHEQFHPAADGILFLSLISGRNPDYLITQQVLSAPSIFNAEVEAISTGYLLIDGNKNTAVQMVSGTKPIPQREVQQIVDTATAAYLMGMKLLYLDAGSGAYQSIQPNLIEKLAFLNLPIIVGGGITAIQQIKALHQAGCQLVVIGNKLETHVDFIDDLIAYKRTLHA